MRRFISLLFLALVLAIVPTSTFSAGWHEEQTAITATAATSDQASAVIMKPQRAKGVLVWLDGATGTTVSLDINIMYFSPAVGVGTLYYWFKDCPTDGAINSDSNWRCLFVDDGGLASPNYASATWEFRGALPTFFIIRVDHENANAATYVVYYQWIW